MVILRKKCFVNNLNENDIFSVYSAWTKVGDFTKTNITGTAATKETETDSEPVKGK